MGNIICNNCGEKAFSKCPNHRHIFGGNQMGNILSHILTIEMEDPVQTPEFTKAGATAPEFANLTVTFKRLKNEDGAVMTLEQMVESLHDILADLLHPKEGSSLKGLTLKQFVCNHEWAWEEGHSDSIGCGCKLAPLKKEKA
jgi:hypothetical protein